MNRNAAFLLSLILAASGCAGAKLKAQQAKIDSLESQSRDLLGQLTDRTARIDTLQSERAELDGKLSDATQKLSFAQAHVDSLVQSNNELSESLETDKGHLAVKVKRLVAEKDALSLQLNEAQKTKLELGRAKATLQAKKDRLAAELAAAKRANEALGQKLSAIEAEKTRRDEDLAARIDKTRQELEALAAAMPKELGSDRAKLAQSSETISITLQEPLLFEPQQAKLTKDGSALLARLGAALRELPAREFRIEGYSDNAPIKWELFGHFTSHWDLSSARATAVARYLSASAGLDPARLTASGFGEFRPVKPNDSPEGRAANRRVVIVAVPAAP